MRTEETPDIAGTIVRLRTEHGLTQQELADRIAVSRSLVSMWELGTRTPDLLSVERMAELFGVEKGDVVPDARYVFIGGELNAVAAELAELTEPTAAHSKSGADPVSVLDAFLAKLKQKDRELFLCRYLEMKAFKTIAGESGINESTVKSRLLRLRKKFRQFVSKEHLK
ncbi:MAG: helix-turn-helix domain-containing protein [Clostridia bacterium]|nr:helix-turn-helix domain-containing protein [Clostridia bacterium]